MRANIKENKERIKQLEIELESSQTQKDTLHNQLLLTQKKLPPYVVLHRMLSHPMWIIMK